MRVMRVQGVPQEIQPFHHHELHGLVELRSVGSLSVLHALPGGICTIDQQIRQLLVATQVNLMRVVLTGLRLLV